MDFAELTHLAENPGPPHRSTRLGPHPRRQGIRQGPSWESLVPAEATPTPHRAAPLPTSTPTSGAERIPTGPLPAPQRPASVRRRRRVRWACGSSTRTAATAQAAPRDDERRRRPARLRRRRLARRLRRPGRAFPPAANPTATATASSATAATARSRTSPTAPAWPAGAGLRPRRRRRRLRQRRPIPTSSSRAGGPTPSPQPGRWDVRGRHRPRRARRRSRLAHLGGLRRPRRRRRPRPLRLPLPGLRRREPADLLRRSVRGEPSTAIPEDFPRCRTTSSATTAAGSST